LHIFNLHLGSSVEKCPASCNISENCYDSAYILSMVYLMLSVIVLGESSPRKLYDLTKIDERLLSVLGCTSFPDAIGSFVLLP
jgi:hypothetical protein